MRISTAASRSPAIVPGGGEPVDARHLDVEDREVGLELAHELDRLVAAAGLADDLVALFLEDLLEVEADDRLVLGDDDTDRVGHERPFGSSGWFRTAQCDGSSAAMRSSSASCSRSSSAIERAQRVAVAAEGVGVAATLAGLGVGERRLGDERPQPGVLGLLLEEQRAAPRRRRARRAGRLRRSLTSMRRRWSSEWGTRPVYGPRLRSPMGERDQPATRGRAVTAPEES